MHGFARHGLPCRRDAIEHADGLVEKCHGLADGRRRYAARAQRVLDSLGESLEGRGEGRPHCVFGFEKLDVVEHLIGALVGHRLERAHDPVSEEWIHSARSLSWGRPLRRP